MPRKPPIWKQLGVSKKEVRAYQKVLAKRFRWTGWVSGLACGLVMLLAIPILLMILHHTTAMSYRAVAAGQIDKSDMVFEWLSFATVGGMSVIGSVAAYWLRVFLVNRILRRHITEPRCIFCGYDLKGHAHITGNYITCPECGKDSPRVHVPVEE